MDVNIRDAKVKTASVEVKSLTLNDRQVTLSVFRQIPCRPVLNDDLTEKGQVWGRVNYRFGDCSAQGEEHLHIVWQSGDVLLRDCIDPSPSSRYQKLFRASNETVDGNILVDLRLHLAVNMLRLHGVEAEIENTHKNGVTLFFPNSPGEDHLFVPCHIGSFFNHTVKLEDHEKVSYGDIQYDVRNRVASYERTLFTVDGGREIPLSAMALADIFDWEHSVAEGVEKYRLKRTSWLAGWPKAYSHLAMSQQLYIAV